MAEINGNDDHNFLIGSSADDFIRGHGGNDVLYGLNGNDNLEGGNGGDYLHGGNGFDFIDFRASSAVIINLKTGSGAGGQAFGDTYVSIEGVRATAQGDWLVGNDVGNILDGRDGVDLIAGEGGNDELWGGGGNDNISGGAGDDELLGGVGADILDGGEGSDLADYFSSTSGVTVDLATGVGLGGLAQGDRFHGEWIAARPLAGCGC